MALRFFCRKISSKDLVDVGQSIANRHKVLRWRAASRGQSEFLLALSVSHFISFHKQQNLHSG